uniref:Ketosynthase family 3 (KS3) domain-containing protein n=1 Tax=Timema tahoe TaxID=61484 RepID=A0A7R9NVA9_9NEOP|nr:unnamed protein product [Timema tahoe]
MTSTLKTHLQGCGITCYDDVTGENPVRGQRSSGPGHHGPSYTIQSGETSGVEALTLAYEAIKNGHCETALAGAVSFALHPEMSYHYKGLGVLSENGCNRSFDENGRTFFCLKRIKTTVRNTQCENRLSTLSLLPVEKSLLDELQSQISFYDAAIDKFIQKATGFVRSEASVVMFLQKAKYAKRIYASIVHSEFDCYGDRKSGYIVPLEYPLTSFLSRFYQRCGIDPSLISYLEADGSGIKVGTLEKELPRKSTRGVVVVARGVASDEPRTVWSFFDVEVKRLDVRLNCPDFASAILAEQLVKARDVQCQTPATFHQVEEDCLHGERRTQDN